MLNAFLTFLNDYPLDLPNRRTLLAVSGGVDSLVLATLFYEKKFPFAIAHCNFNLRGAESDEDEKFVIAWADKHGVQIYSRRFDTLASKKSLGISTQMAARNLRHDWFRELKSLHDYDFVATAHHADDAIETLLLNLTRGTGLPGLPGIAPVGDYLIRPLLYASKADILEFARKNGVAFREDSSNQSTHYRRNLLRQEVLPVLQSINPNLEGTFRYTAERLRAADHLLSDILAQWQRKAQRQAGEVVYISIPAIQDSSEPAYRLHHCLETFGFSYAQSRQIASVLGNLCGKQFFSGSHQLVVDRTELIIQPIDASPYLVPVLVLEDSAPVALSDSEFLTVSYPTDQPDFAETPPTVAYLDATKVIFPLTIRSWQAGDFLRPLGLAGRAQKGQRPADRFQNSAS